MKANHPYSIILLLGAILVVTIAFSFSGCDAPLTPPQIFTNPMDTASSTFVSPFSTIISGPEDGDIITTESVIFNWKGNSSAYQFSYMIDSSGWSTSAGYTSAYLEYLDEGQHTFIVRALHLNTTSVESNPHVTLFTVDAVKGPSAMFTPRRIYAAVGQPFTFSVSAEEVNSLYGARLSIRYDPAKVAVDTISPGSMMQGNGGSAILLPTIDNATGTILVDIATVGRHPKGVSGSGTLAVLKCRALTMGNADFTFVRSDCSYRDTLNTPVAIRDLVGGRVVIR